MNEKAHSNYDKSGVFLATTALEEFWDTSKLIVFLGEWCKRYSRRAIWENLDAVVLPSPFKETEKPYEAYLYSTHLYERALRELVEILNGIHGKNYGERYWRILIGPWLFHYIDVLYERYTALKIAYNKYPDLVTVGLANECFIIARDTAHHHDLLGDDLYNLQIYTRLLDELGKKYQIKKSDLLTCDENLRSPDFLNKTRSHLKNILRNCLQLFYKQVYKQNFNIVGHDSYFAAYVDLFLFLKTRGRYRPFIERFGDVKALPIDESLRSKIEFGGLGTTEFETILSHTLPKDMPQCFLETYELLGREMRNHYPPYPPVIFSTNSSYFNEYFKQWAAEAIEKGTIFLGVQHGGNYGSDLFMRAMDHEIAITDRFYSWGWKLNGPHSKISPMPATKLVGRKIIGPNNRKEGVLFTCTSAPRYLFRIQTYNNEIFPDYIDWQFRFYRTLSVDIQRKLRVRLFYNFGWDMYERWKNVFPNVIIEGMEKSFSKSMDNCRIVVCDHLLTVHAESLSAHKPTILFWNPKVIRLKQDCMPYYDELRAAGILHDTPEAAAATLNRVYDDVERWWNQPERQTAVNNYCNRFARTSPHALSEWTKEFTGLDLVTI